MRDLLDRTVHEITRGSVFALLPDETQARVGAMSDADVLEAADRALARPMPGDTSQNARLLLNPCLAVQWLAAFEELALPRELHVYEPCAGSSEPVILALDIYSAGRGSYSTVNLNRPLANQLRAKLCKVRSSVEILDADATLAPVSIAPGSCDIACFHHAINDILQTAVAESHGMRTGAIDWWTEEPTMIAWLADEASDGRLSGRARSALLDAVRVASELVRPGGHMLFDHWTWEAHRRAAWFPWQLFCDLIPLARAWIREEQPRLVERPMRGRDPQWWMCLVTGSGT